MAVIYRGTGKTGQSIITTDKSKVDTSKAFTSSSSTSSTNTSTSKNSSGSNSSGSLDLNITKRVVANTPEPNWNTLTAKQIKESGYSNLSQLQAGYRAGEVNPISLTKFSSTNQSNVTPLNQGKTDSLTIVTVDPKTGKETVTRQGRTNSRYTGLPSIAPPSQQAISDFYASQKVDTKQGASINERVLAQELARPGSTQTIYQGFMQPGSVQGANVQLAMQGLSKPASKRSYEEQVAIIQASQGSESYQRQLELRTMLRQQELEASAKKIATQKQNEQFFLQQKVLPTERPKIQVNSKFTNLASEGGQSLVKGDIVGGASKLGASFLTGVGEAGQLISSTGEVVSDYALRDLKYVPETGLGVFNPLTFPQRGVYLAGSFGKGLGSGVSLLSGVAKESPVLVVGGLSAIPVLGGKFISNPIGSTLKVTSSGISLVGGVVSSLGTSIIVNPVKFAGEFAGGYAAFGLAGKSLGILKETFLIKPQTIGKQYIPRENLELPEIKSGVKTFPEAKSAADALKKFNQESYKMATGKPAVYSATDAPISKRFVVGMGRGLEKAVDVPGIYASLRGVSTYFLRLKKGLADYKLIPTSIKDLLPKQPKILAFLETPGRLPASLRTSFSKAQAAFGKTSYTKDLLNVKGVKPGFIEKEIARLSKIPANKPIISPALEFGFKKEAEAVFRVGGEFQQVGLNNVWSKITGFSKYTKINGRIVPIKEFESVGVSSVFKGGLKQVVDVADYAKSSSGVTTSYLVSPINVSSAVLASSKFSVPSVSSSISSSFKISPIISVPKVSSVSYSPKISSIVASSYVEPSYVPSKIISKTSSGISRVSSSSYIPKVERYTPPTYTSTNYSSSKSTSYKLIPSYSVPKKYTSYTPPIIPPPKIPIYDSKKQFKEFEIKKKKFKLKKAFSVVSRVKGKKKVLAVGVPRNLALAIGKGFTEGTTARSFKIREVGLTQRQDIGLVNLSQYRTPKFSGRVAREGFTFVEKSRFAINTPGEVRELKVGKVKAKLFK